LRLISTHSHSPRKRRREKVIQIKAPDRLLNHIHHMWRSVESAPYGRSLELAVIDQDGVHALVFPCERGAAGWKNVATGARVDIRPTHWRAWDPAEDKQDSLLDPL